MAPRTIPDAISAAVSTLLVLCMDVAMLYAASMLRILLNRRAEQRELQLHVAVLACAAVLEASTYCYMAALYDRPTTAAAWALITARAVAAPLFGVYLSLARPLPVGPRDIMYAVELETGRGMLRDVARRVAEPGDLAAKLAMYQAAAPIQSGEATRLSNLIEVVSARGMPELPPPSGGSPVTLLPASVPDAEAAPDTPVVQFASLSERVAKLVYLDPTLSVAELAVRAGVSKETASKYKKEALARLAATQPAVPLDVRLEA